MFKPNQTGVETPSSGVTQTSLLRSSGNLDMAHLYEISKWCNVIFVTVIISFGIIGNYMAAIIFLSKYYKKFALRQHLVMLSCADLLFLITHYLDYTLRAWVNLTGQHEAIFNFVDHSVFFCKLFSYMRDVLRTISAYTLLLMTFQRFVRLYFPLKCGKWCAQKINRKLLMLIVVISFAVNPADLFLVDVVDHGITKHPNCNVKIEYLRVHFFADLTFACFTVFLPTMLIAILSFILWKKISSNVPKYYFLSCSCRHPDSNLDDYSSHQMGNYEPSQHANGNSECFENNYYIHNNNSSGNNKSNLNKEPNDHCDYEPSNNGFLTHQNGLPNGQAAKRKASNETSFSLNGHGKGHGRGPSRFLAIFKSSKDQKLESSCPVAQSLLPPRLECKSEMCLNTGANGMNIRGIQSGNGVLNLMTSSASMNNITQGQHKSSLRQPKSSKSLLMNKIRIINLMRKGGYSIRATYILVLISKWFIVLQIPYFVCWAITHSNLYKLLLNSQTGEVDTAEFVAARSSNMADDQVTINPATALYTNYYHKDLGHKNSGYRLYSRDLSYFEMTTTTVFSVLLNETISAATQKTDLVTVTTSSGDDDRDQLMPIVRILNNLFEILYLSSYSINFYLYMLNGPQFRKFSKKILYNHFHKIVSCFKFNCFAQRCRRDHVENTGETKA